MFTEKNPTEAIAELDDYIEMLKSWKNEYDEAREKIVEE